jgi:4-aminobutyrate aminotransferase-like enzyme
VRQAGLHIGVELVKDPATREPDPGLYAAVRKKGMEKGIIFGLGGTAKNVLKIKPPPLIVTAAGWDGTRESRQTDTPRRGSHGSS